MNKDQVTALADDIEADGCCAHRKEIIKSLRQPAQPDCRTCRYYACLNGCFRTAACTNGDKYQPAPAVVLWRTN